MSVAVDHFDYLLQDDGPAAIVVEQWLKPANGSVIFPPTYANPSQKKGDPPVYNIDRFGETVTLKKTLEKVGKVQSFTDVERTEHGRERSVCIIDSIPSQANRIEPAFAQDIAQGQLVPRVVIKLKIKDDEGEREEQVNLLMAGHRAADAIVRFSSLADEIGKAIRARRAGNSLPLAKIAPTSLVFGMWDSRATGVKVPRLFNSIIRAFDVLEFRRSAQYFPAADYAAAGVVPEKGEKGFKKLADQGMAEVPATFTLGGIEARGGICREACINLATLRDIVAIVKKQNGSIEEIDTLTSRDQTLKLQRYILGLALVALTWFDGKSLNLRQGCQLVGMPDKPMTRRAAYPDGTFSDFPIDRDSAVEYAKAAAQDFGVGEPREGVFDPKKAREALKKQLSEETE